jgi:hypothetical protein
MSEDKVRRKEMCGSVREVYVLEKLPDVRGPNLVEAGRYNVYSTTIDHNFSLTMSL